MQIITSKYEAISYLRSVRAWMKDNYSEEISIAYDNIQNVIDCLESVD